MLMTPAAERLGSEDCVREKRRQTEGSKELRRSGQPENDSLQVHAVNEEHDAERQAQHEAADLL
jgi:hypothetical protein